MLKIDKGQLTQIGEDFFSITGLQFVLYDTDLNITHTLLNNAPFCKALRASAELEQKCLECDRSALKECAKRNVPLIYHCHMGLTEACAPIVDNNTVIGYLMVGQTLGEGDMENILATIDSLHDDTAVDKAVLRHALSEMTPVSKDVLGSASRILGICACYLCSNNIVAVRRSDIWDLIISFINQDLASEELTVEGLCRRFGISRSLLYSMSRKQLGMGISQYIRKCRIHAAKKLLRKDELPICRIAAECGFATPSYFTKVFSEQVGCLPKEYAAK